MYADEQYYMENYPDGVLSSTDVAKYLKKASTRIVKFGVRNKTMQVFADYSDKVEGFAQFIEEVPPDKIRHAIGITQQVDQLKNIM